ncbi:MAG: DUF1549 and DUF1553 domain-containing protein [Myxococcota bacterium]
MSRPPSTSRNRARRSASSLAALFIVAAVGGCSTSDRGTDSPTGPSPTVPSNAAVDGEGLDALIAAQWNAAGVQPTTEVDDAEFLRRVTLDLIGRIPTTEEAQRFAADTSPDKRAAAVDDLLQRDAWAEHWSQILGDLLLGDAAQQRPRFANAFHTWLEGRLLDGATWDELTREMLTATEHAPGGFLLVNGRGNRVEALTGQTARVFLGLQLQCAQCHDDPDDRFTQAEFYGLAAYYARTRGRSTTLDGVKAFRVIDKPRGEMRMPTEQDAPGDRSGPRVDPAFPAIDAMPGNDETRRQALARGIIGSDFFAKATVNRTWAQMMGRGIVDPWDDLGGLADNDHPALLEHLAADFAAHGYDLHHLMKTIALSSAYQRSSQGDDEGSAARERAFAQAALRPMSGPQLLRSLLVATGLEDVKGRKFRRQLETRRRQLQKDFDLVFDDDEMSAADVFTGNVPQALLLLNGELTNQGVAASDGALSQILDTHEEPGARIDALFWRLYGRAPSPDRRTSLVATMTDQGNTRGAYEDLMHAMLVSSEFLTLH